MEYKLVYKPSAVDQMAVFVQARDGNKIVEVEADVLREVSKDAKAHNCKHSEVSTVQAARLHLEKELEGGR